MKQIKSLLIFSIACIALASCNSNNGRYNEVTLLLNDTEIPYNESGVWTEVYNNDKQIMSQNMHFSHSALTSEYGSSWNGFVPSRSTDINDYGDNLYNYQWSAMSQGGLSGKGTPYMVAYWNSSESKDVDVSEASCRIYYGNKLKFEPQSMYVNNNSYAYYTILNGSTYNKKFADGDYFVLHIYGVKEGGEKVGPVDYYLADYRDGKKDITKDWSFVNLDTLGEVQYLYFQMESSDTGSWGMNTPAYFCLDRLKLIM